MICGGGIFLVAKHHMRISMKVPKTATKLSMSIQLRLAPLVGMQSVQRARLLLLRS